VVRVTIQDRDELVHDSLIDEAEAAELEHGGTRNLFDLRTIIGGLFTLYGVVLTVYGAFDGDAAVAKAAGVRINLWAGLGMLALGLVFLLWVKLRPLTVEEIVEAHVEDVEEERAREAMEQERGQAR
jgi:hypothetical protein